MPSLPGLAISAQGLDVSPLTVSLLLETVMVGQDCCASAGGAISIASRPIMIDLRRTAPRQWPARSIFLVVNPTSPNFSRKLTQFRGRGKSARTATAKRPSF
jgi:hypothetical protein